MKIYSYHTIPDRQHLSQEELTNFIDRVSRSDQSGLDGICLAPCPNSSEKTQTPTSFWGSLLAQITKHSQIVLINELPLLSNPVMLAEELALVDRLSHGRLQSAFSMGCGQDYRRLGINPTFARSRFDEALSLIKRVWHESKPFDHDGDLWKFKDISPLPLHEQNEHRPIWIMGDGSPETIEYAARNQAVYVDAPHFHGEIHKKNLQQFRKKSNKHGDENSIAHSGWIVPVYVSETDEQAWEELSDQLQTYASQHLTQQIPVTPGLMSTKSIAKLGRSYQKSLSRITGQQEIIDGFYAIVGSPPTVIHTLNQAIETLGINLLLCDFHLHSLTGELGTKSQTLFVQKVMPELQQLATDTNS